MTRHWRNAALTALATVIMILSLFYYWFGIADRYVLFLYFHDMGLAVPETAPFSRVTASRYWMAGLVAGGAVMVLNTAVNWLLGRFASNYRPPNWWWVWGWTAPPLLVGIPLITMTVNEPVLPLANAAQATLATLAALALASLPGRLAAERPGALIWLTLDGIGLMLIMTTLNNLDNLGLWLARGRTLYVWLAILMLVAGVVWLLFLTGFQRRWQTAVYPWYIIFIAGWSVSYLLMPLAHHLLFTDGYYYISNSDNFFSRRLWLQLAAWGLMAMLTIGLARLRRVERA